MHFSPVSDIFRGKYILVTRDMGRKNIHVTKYVSWRPSVDKSLTTILLLRASMIKANKRVLFFALTREFSRRRKQGKKEKREECFLIKRVQIALKCSATRHRFALGLLRGAHTRNNGPAKEGNYSQSLFQSRHPISTNDFCPSHFLINVRPWLGATRALD